MKLNRINKYKKLYIKAYLYLVAYRLTLNRLVNLFSLNLLLSARIYKICYITLVIEVMSSFLFIPYVYIIIVGGYISLIYKVKNEIQRHTYVWYTSCQRKMASNNCVLRKCLKKFYYKTNVSKFN